jgi:diguanylate cyclase (GGDEF)-like protein
MAGLKLARQNPPDLLLLDVNLDQIDGFGLADLLTQQRTDSQAPVLFQSGSADLERRFRENEHVCADFLKKPYQFEELIARIERILRMNERIKTYRSLSMTDDLTQLGNLRLLQERVAVERARADRQVQITALVIDVDKLKLINDRHGHQAGSDAIVCVARILQESKRQSDVAVRSGGDEFVALLSAAGEREGELFANRVLAQVRKVRVHGDPFSVSIGIASVRPGAHDQIMDAIARADKAVYSAKRLGGNCACLQSTLIAKEQPVAARQRRSNSALRRASY